MPKKLSKAVWEQRIRDSGAGRYEFVRWAVDEKHGSASKCVVRCAKDGHEWIATPNNFINKGSGCPQCSCVRRWTADERIEQINSLENIEFVSWVDGYKNQYSKANVKCAVDGFGWGASTNSLANGSGCPQCAGLRRWTAEERIEQINKLENIEFVSWVDGYKSKDSKANVRCEIDVFEWSTRVNDLVNQGSGCPRCAKHGYDKSKTGTLYALRSECGQYVKVGISNNPSQRHKQLEMATPFSFSCVESIAGDGTKIHELEKHFHSRHELAGFVGFDGATEWLVCTPQLLKELRELEDVK